MEAKKKVIQKAWSSLGFDNEKPDSDGWVIKYEYNIFTETLYIDRKDLDIENVFHHVTEINGNRKKVRPKYLQGIENNNGWIKYNPVHDFPNGWYWVKTGGGRTFVVEVINSRNTLGVANPSYYKKIEKPQEPIY
jgi:hypothetical protein